MHPIILDFGRITVYSLWVFVSIGLVAAMVAFARLAQRNRVIIEPILQHSLFLFLSILVGARVLFILNHLPLFFYDFDFSIRIFIGLISIWDQGLSFWGGAIGVVASLMYLAKKYDGDLEKWLDLLALAALIGFSIGVVGTFLDGMNHGRETILPWGMTFESRAVKYAVPIHPVQLYALVYMTAITIFSFELHKKLRMQTAGFISRYVVLLYALFRFLEEFFRGDDTIMIAGIIRLPQVLALFVSYFMARHIAKKYSLSLKDVLNPYRILTTL